MGDKKYCMNLNCPFKRCIWHLANAKTAEVRIAPRDDKCKRYLKYLLEVMKNADD